MFDYYLVEDDGTTTAIAELPTQVIRDLLEDGIEVIQEGITEYQLLERLRIELVARAICGRA